MNKHGNEKWTVKIRGAQHFMIWIIIYYMIYEKWTVDMDLNSKLLFAFKMKIFTRYVQTVSIELFYIFHYYILVSFIFHEFMTIKIKLILDAWTILHFHLWTRLLSYFFSKKQQFSCMDFVNGRIARSPVIFRPQNYYARCADCWEYVQKNHIGTWLLLHVSGSAWKWIEYQIVWKLILCYARQVTNNTINKM